MPKCYSRCPGTTVVDRRIGMTDSEMFTANAVDEDCGSDTSTTANPSIQRGTGHPEKGVSGVAPLIERNPDKITSTLEWRGRVLHSQEAAQASTISRQQHAAEERGHASLEEIEIDQIREHYQELERVLEGELVEHKKRYRLAIKDLKREEKEEKRYSADWWGGVQSDYQPTECSDDGCSHLIT